MRRSAYTAAAFGLIYPPIVIAAEQPWTPTGSSWFKNQVNQQSTGGSNIYSGVANAPATQSGAAAASAAYSGLAAASAEGAGLSKSASEIVGGIIDSFLGQSQVSEVEKDCLSKGASSMAGSLTQLCAEAMATFKQLASTAHAAAGASQAAAGPAQGSAPPVNPFAMPATTAAPTMPMAASPMASEGESAVMALMLATKVTELYKTEKEIAKSCLTGDVLEEIETAEEHMTNMTYVGGRLVSNGVDIVSEIADAFAAFQQQDYRSFGHSMGEAWHKALLANRSNHSSLHFKPPSAKAIELVTEGLFTTFFGTGFHMQIVTDAIPLQAAAQPQQLRGGNGAAWPLPPAAHGASATAAPTAYPPMVFNVDLHQCVTGNMPLFKSGWQPMWAMMTEAVKPNASMPSMEDMMMSMVDMQLALTRCGIGPAQEAMLMDAMAAGKLHVKMDVPDRKVSSADVSELVAKAIDDFKEEQWLLFGGQIGKMLQDMVVMIFPQKYEVDSTGKLRSHLLGASETGAAGFSKPQGSAATLTLACAAVASISLAVLVVARSRKYWTREVRFGNVPLDAEEMGGEAVE